jgi:uncharacterized RDD family membrane protein YckC
MTTRVQPIPQEARAFQGRRAGLVTRAAAACIDIALVVLALILAYLVFVVVVVFLVPPRGLQVSVPPLWLELVVVTSAITLYLTLCWHRGGRTYGGLVMGLRVVNRRDRSLGLGMAFLRAAFTVVFPLGLAWVAVSRRNRSIQDVVLGTSVVYDWKVRPGASPVPL